MKYKIKLTDNQREALLLAKSYTIIWNKPQQVVYCGPGLETMDQSLFNSLTFMELLVRHKKLSEDVWSYKLNHSQLNRIEQWNYSYI